MAYPTPSHEVTLQFKTLTNNEAPITLIDATQEHFKQIVELNAAVVELTSPMDQERLGQLHSWCSYHKVALDHSGAVIAFLIAFTNSSQYDGQMY